jgi:hypothetical protein
MAADSEASAPSTGRLGRSAFVNWRSTIALERSWQFLLTVIEEDRVRACIPMFT